MKFRIIIALAFCLALSYEASSQAYESAIGARFGVPISVSYKKFVNEKAAVEGYVGVRSNSLYNQLGLSAAYLIHSDISEVEGLQWYFGGGTSAYRYSYDTLFGGESSDGIFLGINGYIGLEYTLSTAPVSASIDWVPTIILGDGVNTGFGSGYGALSVRYVLGRDSE